jgi:hypothetical protein
MALPASRTHRTGYSLLAGVLASLVVAALLLAALLGVGLLKLGNPFASTTRDASGPALMKALTDLHDFHGSSAQYQQVVDIDQGYRYVPGVIAGRHTTFLATGSVDGIVSFDDLSADAVRVDGKDVTITLPAPHLGQARLDAEQSRVLERDRGVVTRVTEALGDGASDTAYWKAGQEKIQAAAAADPEVLQRAEAATRQTLQQLGTSLGYRTVTVVFTPAATATP